MGTLLGVAIAALILIAIVHDRIARIDFAVRHSLTVATGADRLLKYEIRNIERALTGIAVDADEAFREVPDKAPKLLSVGIDGVLTRHSELRDIALVDDQGRRIVGGPSTIALASWIRKQDPKRAGLHFGPLQGDAAQGWYLPVARRAGTHGWLIAQLRTVEFDRIIGGLDTGRDGVVAVITSDGVLLARSRDARAWVGRKVPLPGHGDLASGHGRERNSVIDGVRRIEMSSKASGYPLIVVAAIGMQELLAPWYLYTALATSLFVVYWVGLIYLVRRIANSESSGRSMLKALRDSGDRLREAQLAGRTATWQITEGSDRVQTSEHLLRLFGMDEHALPEDGAGVLLELFFERIHPDDRERVREAFQRTATQGDPFFAEFRVHQADGGLRWLSGRGERVAAADGHTRIAGTTIDISERREAQARVEDAERHFRQTFERNPLPFWVYDTETLKFVAVNDAAIRSYGYSREAFLAMTIFDIRSIEEAERLRDAMADGDHDAADADVWLHRAKDGRQFEVRTQSAHIDFAGRPALLVLAEDVSHRIAYERDLAFRATHDVGTGLLTAPALMELLDGMRTDRRDDGAGYVVAYVQLRDIELIAPTLGRRVGEEILTTAARRFGWLGETFGFTAYLPAETFIVVAIEPSQRDELIAGLTRALSATIEGRDTTHHLEAWIGLADFPADGEDAEQVIGNAALAALQARKNGVPYVAFDAVMAGQASERLAMVARIHQALERGEFELFFQPIRGVVDRALIALEALIRWRQPDGSYVPPLQFIPLCEESGLIVPLGKWVLEEAARMHGVLARHGLAEVAIAVNVSAAQFHGTDLPGELRRLTAQYALPRGALHVELTESVLLRPSNAAVETMRQLQKEGVCISLDDFGTGFSSMAYLRDLPIDALKIDRGFVADVDRDERAAAICRALIALGHSVGLKIIAEGVEEAGQYAWLRTHGCDQVQGYYFGRPAPLEAVLAQQARDAV